MRREHDDGDGGEPWRRQFASWHRDGRVLIGFGGYDGRRLASLAINDDQGWSVRDGIHDDDDDGTVPPPVLHHRTVLRGRALIVIGGRTRPAAPSTALYVLDLDAWRWEALDGDGDGPSPRYRFALAHDPASDRAFVSGGIEAGPRLCDDLCGMLALAALPTSLTARRHRCPGGCWTCATSAGGGCRRAAAMAPGRVTRTP